MFRCILAAIVAVSVIGSTAASGEESILWKHGRSGKKIGHFEVTPLGSVFVSTDDRVAALDADTGDVIWVREDIRRCGKNDEDGTIRCNFLGKGSTVFSAIANTKFGLFQVIAKKIFSSSKGGFRGWENPCDRVAVVDLATGSTIFDSVDIPFKKVSAFLYVPKLNQFMLSGEVDDKRGVLVAISGSDGALLWQRDIDFLDRFKFIGVPDDARVLAYGTTQMRGRMRVLVSLSLTDGAEHWRLNGFLANDARNRNALVLRDTDETAILYVTKDGPFRVRLDSGKVLWRRDRWDKDPPEFAPMVLDGELLFVPNGKRIDALHVEDGSRVWQTLKNFRTEPINMHMLSRGLLVRARSFDLLDPQTGRSLWTKRTDKFPVESPEYLDEDAAYIAEKKRFSTIDLATGGVTRLAKYDFHGDMPAQMEETDGSFVLMSRQNLLRVSPAGEIAYHVYLKAPGASGWMKALAVAAAVGSVAATGAQSGSSRLTFSANVDLIGVMGARYGATFEALENYFMYTEMPFEGRKGFSLVRIEKKSGKETGRLWLDERSPNYSIDYLTETVYFQNADHELSALRFVPDLTDLAPSSSSR